MHHRLLFLLATLVAATTVTSRAATPSDEHPLASSRLAVRASAAAPKRAFKFAGTWRGTGGTSFNPKVAISTLRVQGGEGEADSGVITLDAARWRVTRRGFRYVDRLGTAGGVQSITVEFGRRGGSLHVSGGTTRWSFLADQLPTAVGVTLTIGPARWCAQFEGPFTGRGGRLRGSSTTAPATCPCNAGLAGTWPTIQQAILERHGCTTAVCHGASAAGGLDLRPDVAYANLVGVASTSVPDRKRIQPGDQSKSVFWQKLAKATQGGFDDLPGAGMPSGQPPLSSEELNALTEWIHAGAPESGVVAGTDRGLAACLPPPDPIKIQPPGPLPSSEGVQLYGPPWTIPANGESEVCYSTYYDVSSVVPLDQQLPCPDDLGGAGRTCWAYKRRELTQDPNSHHSIVDVYVGAYDWTDPGWGTWTCHGGANDGVACDPTGLGVAAPTGAECGERSACAGSPLVRPGCLGYGPPDFGAGASVTALGTNTAPSISIATQPYLDTRFPQGVYDVMPITGLVVWNSHAFNVSAAPTTNEQWIDFFYAANGERSYTVDEIFESQDIFIADVPAFEEREYCRTTTFPKGTRIFELTTHTHQRGRVFRIWGPGIAPSCASSSGTCLPETTPPILTTLNYADPAVTRYDPPLALDDEDAASRTFKFCAIFDNGRTDPTTVRRATGVAAYASPCPPAQRACLDGPHRGAPCLGDARVCDSRPGANDGVCDACPSRGGITTDDEMFIMMGKSFFVPPAP